MKTRLDDLAMFGGAPAFGEPLHVGRPNLGDRTTFLDRINQILDSRWLSNMGPLEQEFENRVANAIGVEHCIAVCNATMALEIAIRALDLKGEVIVPSFTFVATAHALQWQRITPVFCDIDPNTHNLDPAKVEAMITAQTSGILAVHLWGRPCDITALQAIADKYHLKLLFDAAHAFGCSYGGKQIGGFGDAEILSFHATKFVNSFEGGAVVTNNAQLAAQIRLMRNFGFSGYDEVTQLGINGKMSEVCAAMGLTSLEAMDEIVEVNHRNWQAYREGLTGLPGISLLAYDDQERHNYHYIVIEVDSTRAALERDELLELLHKENVLARRYFWPGCHRMEPYKSLYPNARLSLAQTERVAARIITLPTGQTVTPEMIGKVCNIIRMGLENAPAIRAVLKQNPTR